MKTKIIVIGIIIAYVIGVLIIGCQDPPLAFPALGAINYEFNIPDEIYRYYEITSSYNRKEATITEDVLDTEYDVLYDVEVTGRYPIILEFRKNNRPIDREFIIHCIISAYINGNGYRKEINFNVNDCPNFTNKVKRAILAVEVDEQADSLKYLFILGL